MDDNMTVTASISEIYDLSTQVGRGTVIKVHTPTGNNIKRHLMGHFLQYKKFKYLGADVMLVPASTLPADPLQLGYEEGEPTIDPRDMVNPILYKYYHGEAMLTDGLERDFPDPYGVNSANADNRSRGEHIGHSVDEQFYLNGTTDSEFDTVYPNCLMDPSFRKAGVQTGFRVRCRPFVYQLVTDRQYLSNIGINMDGSSNTTNLDTLSSNTPNWQEDNGIISMDVQSRPIELETVRGTQANSQFVGNLFTNKLQRLGWMDTVTRVWNVKGTITGADFYPGALDSMDNVALNPYPESGSPSVGSAGAFAMQTYLPNIPMLYILMPPAYKTMFYFRLLIKHHYAFSGFRSCYNIQSYGTAAIGVPVPVPYVTSIDAGTLATEISDMIADTGTGGPDSITVENGEVMSSADGIAG